MRAIDVLKYLLEKAESETPEGHRIVGVNVPVDIVREIIDAQPERKVGNWKGYRSDNPKWLRDDGSPVFLECSACNTIVMNNGSAYWNFCPNCGADMRGKQNEH